MAPNMANMASIWPGTWMVLKDFRCTHNYWSLCFAKYTRVFDKGVVFKKLSQTETDTYLVTVARQAWLPCPPFRETKAQLNIDSVSMPSASVSQDVRKVWLYWEPEGQNPEVESVNRDLAIFTTDPILYRKIGICKRYEWATLSERIRPVSYRSICMLRI